MKKIEDFKYRSKFSIPLKSFATFKVASQDKLIANANLSNLGPLMPAEQIRKENPDILYVAFNAAVANLINANDDGLRTEEALKINKLFASKYVNIEHMKFNVVGHIVNSAFTSFADSSILNEADLVGTSDPFNMALAAAVWKNVDPYFCDFLENNSEIVSASWELLFDEFYIVRGSKRLKDAEIITEEAKIKELLPYLRCNGGCGFDKTGTEIYRLIINDVLPLGCGFTLNPAAAVSGTFPASKMDEMMKTKEMVDQMLEQETEDDDEEDEGKCKPKASSKMKKCKDCGKCLPEEGKKVDPEMEMCKCKPKASMDEEEDTCAKCGKPKAKDEGGEVCDPKKEKCKCKPKANTDAENKNNSQFKNSDVIDNKMKISKIDDIQQDKWAEIQASSVREFIQEELKRVSQTFEEAKAQTEAEQKALAEQKAKAEQEVKDSVEKISKLEVELSEIKAAQAAQEIQAKFNERMSSLNEDYNLTKETSEIVAKQIKGLSDEDYTNWKAQFEVLSASLKKVEAKKEDKKEDIESVATKNLENVEENKTQTIPNASSVTENTNEKLAKSFKLGEGVVVAKRK